MAGSEGRGECGCVSTGWMLLCLGVSGAVDKRWPEEESVVAPGESGRIGLETVPLVPGRTDPRFVDIVYSSIGRSKL